uniref:Uncharacterized protein n=1 Tax=Panagrolaimus sp. PS1159 TaxID=55785 RepID=A0AC35FX28_9BILA
MALSNRLKKLKAARAILLAKKAEKRKAAAALVKEEFSTFSDPPVKQEATTESPSTSQSTAAKASKVKRNKKIKVEIDSEISIAGQNHVKKRVEKGDTALPERLNRARRAKSTKEFQQNAEGENEAVNRINTVALPALSNPFAEEINFYRQVPSTDYFNGYNSAGNQCALLIIYQPNDENFAREYYRMNHFWACMGCRVFNKKTYIRILNKEVYAPLNHYCHPRKIEEIIKEQTNYQNRNIYGNVENLERNPAFYSASTEFDKFDSTEYKFGLNNQRLYSRIIVTKKDNPQYVYHYHKVSKRWICDGCFRITKCTDVFGEFVNQDLYLPKEHVCEPMTVKESAEDQEILASTSASVEIQVEKIFEERKDNLRRLFLYDVEFGVSRSGKSLLIVCEPGSDRKLVREYTFKSQSIWYCSRCTKTKKQDVYAIKRKGLLYVALEHDCKPIEYLYSKCNQMSYLNPGVARKKIKYLAAQKGGNRMPFPIKNHSITIPAPDLKKADAPAKATKKRAANPKPKIPRISKKAAVNKPVRKKPKQKRIRRLIKNSRLYQQTGFTYNCSTFPGVVRYPSTPIFSLPPFNFGNESTTNYSNLPSSSFTSYNPSSNVTYSKASSSADFKNGDQTKSENIIPSEMDELHVKSVESVSSALLKFIENIKSSRNESSLKIEEPTSCFSI